MLSLLMWRWAVCGWLEGGDFTAEGVFVSGCPTKLLLLSFFLTGCL